MESKKSCGSSSRVYRIFNDTIEIDSWLGIESDARRPEPSPKDATWAFQD